MQKIMARQVIWFFQYIKNQHKTFRQASRGSRKRVSNHRRPDSDANNPAENAMIPGSVSFCAHFKVGGGSSPRESSQPATKEMNRRCARVYHDLVNPKVVEIVTRTGDMAHGEGNMCGCLVRFGVSRRQSKAPVVYIGS
jgi:hypothetical protein